MKSIEYYDVKTVCFDELCRISKDPMYGSPTINYYGNRLRGNIEIILTPGKSKESSRFIVEAAKIIASEGM